MTNRQDDLSCVVYFGGSFDPVHNGHLELAKTAADQLDCQKVMLLPCYQPPHKRGLSATPSQRLDMLLAVVDDLRSDNTSSVLFIDERELLRTGPSYTVDTLIELRREVGPEACLVFIIGWDSLQNLHTWHRWQELFSFSNFLVVPRAGYRLIQSNDVRKHFDKRLVSITQLKKMPAGGISVLEIKEMDLSSTRIRELIRKGQLSSCDIPESVKKLIERDKLYQQK